MVQRIKVEERDAKLPFNTVDEALEFGSKKVAEFKEKRQLEMQNSQGFSQDQISSNNIFSTSLDDLNPLNFNSFLEEYESELNRNIGENSQLKDRDISESIVELEKDKVDLNLDLDLDDDIDLNVGDDDLKRSKNNRSKNKAKGKNKSGRSNREKKNSKKKVVLVSRNQQQNNRNRAAAIDKSSDVKKQLNTSREQTNKDVQSKNKKVIVSRKIEVVGRNEYTGQDISRQVDQSRSKSIVNDNKQSQSKLQDISPTMPKIKSLQDKIEDTKLALHAKNLVNDVAMITHQTGRTTEFNVGKDVLKFERQGQDTFALKNGEKISINDAQNMLKKLGRDIGLNKLEQLSKIVKVAQENPRIQTLSQNKGNNINKEQEQVKVQVGR